MLMLLVILSQKSGHEEFRFNIVRYASKLIKERDLKSQVPHGFKFGVVIMGYFSVIT